MPSKDNKASLQKLSLNLKINKLKKGKIQLFTHKNDILANEKERITGVLLVNSSEVVLWKVISDFDSLSNCIPGLDYYRTLHIIKPIEKGEKGKAIIEGKLKIPIFNIIFTLQVIFDEPNLLINWRLLTDEEIKTYNENGILIKKKSPEIINIEGFSYIEPYSNNQLLLYYAPLIETSVLLPSFLKKNFIKKAISNYMHTIRDRAVDLMKNY